MSETKEQIIETLKSIREAIDDEGVSYGEIYYLQTHQQDVMDYGDIMLAQWAGISEVQWNNGCLYDKDQLLEDLKTLNKVEQLQELVLDGTVYKIMLVRHFEDEYDYDDDFDGKLNDFLKHYIDNDQLDELDLGGVCITQDTSNDFEEDKFISFVELATRYKGYVEIREHKTVISI